MFSFEYKCAVTPSCGSSSRSLPVYSESVKQRGNGAGSTSVVGAGGARCDNNKEWCCCSKGCVQNESVHVAAIHLRYTIGICMYKYGWKYATLWTCLEGSVYIAVFLLYIVVACTVVSIL